MCFFLRERERERDGRIYIFIIYTSKMVFLNLKSYFLESGVLFSVSFEIHANPHEAAPIFWVATNTPPFLDLVSLRASI